ncbi:glutathione S-transferase [Neohortaea acidophila]|uniref:Glutathione S-transferase n=1 Tax=Neohortaea acidophila TaxID=245834 RepID=A0A6A6PID4_9PEZI|nr:glutathione S-transferase [Neohortaea acidophila]KAF2479481.1 glutathione S-transferase [Neohortaea acidophila]
MTQPVKLYSHAGGPNPWKVAIIMEELGVPYESIMMDFGDLKKEPFESINPNGRVPAIEVPQSGLKLWESGAIIDYLLETHDKNNSLSYTSVPEKYDTKAWFELQKTGQGPYFGQRAWFTLYHQDKIDSCLDRYGNEIRRVIGVIDAHLKKTGTPYLVGDKLTYADLAFMPWHWLLLSPPHIMGADFPNEWKEKYPTAWAWNERVSERPSVKKVREDRSKAIAASKK